MSCEHDVTAVRLKSYYRDSLALVSGSLREKLGMISETVSQSHG